MRRDSNDLQWQKVKRFVAKRDNNSCRLLTIISARDFLILKQNAGFTINILDPAHIFPVGPYPALMYNPNNIVMLNRTCHERLDTCHDPITNLLITQENRDIWWKRIIGEKLYDELYQLTLKRL